CRGGYWRRCGRDGQHRSGADGRRDSRRRRWRGCRHTRCQPFAIAAAPRFFLLSSTDRLRRASSPGPLNTSGRGRRHAGAFVTLSIYLNRMPKFAAVVFLLATWNARVLAQTEPGAPPPNVQMRLGPLYVNPRIALTNAGTDTNVFNESVNPKSDFTVTVTPGTDLWLRVGPTWLQSNINEDLVWFQKY